MKFRFSLSLQGASWWKSLLILYGAFLAALIPWELLAFNQAKPEKFNPLVRGILTWVALLLVIQVCFICLVFIYRHTVNSLTISRKQCSFTGHEKRFLQQNMGGFGLTLLTLGLYLPWLIKSLVTYLTIHTVYQGKKMLFPSSGKRLFKNTLLGVIVPLALWALFQSLLPEALVLKKGTPPFVSFLLTLITHLSRLISYLPFVYFFIKWLFNFRWNARIISWKAGFKETLVFGLIHIGLTFITLGLYVPLLIINWHRFIVSHLIITPGHHNALRLGFDAHPVRFFALFWGKVLLCLISLGIYLPWALVSFLKFFIHNTFAEELEDTSV